MIAQQVDETTQKWTRNKSDELAAANGCFFDEERAAWAVWWIERYCLLYEGEWAGQHVLLRSGNPETDKQILEDWDYGGKELSIERAEKYAEWFATGPSPVDWQYECIMRMFGWVRYSDRWQRVIRRFNAASIWTPKKNKKMNHPDERVPTPHGWKRFGELRVGDVLFDSQGDTCNVVCEHLRTYDENWYSVKFSNGQSIRCNGEHLWKTETLIVPEGHSARGHMNQYFGSKTKRVNKSYRVGVWTTEEIRKSLRTKSGSFAHRLRLHSGVQCPVSRGLPVDPYWLGLWLGDGTSADATFTAIKEDGDEYNIHLARRGSKYRLRYRANDSSGTRWNVDNWYRDIRKFGFVNNKHIPAKYLRASFDQRLALLQGLMDTDGCVSRKHGGRSQQCIFSTKLHHLANQFCELLSSLGLKYSRTIEYRNLGDGSQRGYHRITFSPVEYLCPFLLSRKVEIYPKEFGKRSSARSRHVHIVAIEKVDPVESRCITVNSPDGTYLIGDTFLPTHNSPSEAALGVYLTCGDGEQGAKCFGGAKDGNQAKIAMNHAIAMVEQNDELAAECKINRNESSITHLPTRSVYKPLSSANERTKTSKEGINGHILIDETHVVDRDFIKIISRAGISRAEPFQIEVSTAGNNPDGYGKQRQDYARQVETGLERNDQMFVAIYEAPQDLTDEDLKADPIKYGKMANPAWGHTAHEEEFLADFNESKRSISDLADFKMYRLNIWQHTANQWLKMDDWAECAGVLDMADNKGRLASLGLDLAKTRDMSALATILPTTNNRFELYVKLWITEAYTLANHDKAPWEEWQASGELVIIPGEIIQEEYIRDEFTRLCKLLDVRVLIKDPALAADFTEWVEDKHSRVEQIDYPQSAATMEKPIDDFEAAVIDGKIIHEDNACLNWQAGHASVRENHKGQRIIQKPKRDDYRKVDGMVASVMALWGTARLPKRKSVYRRRGVLTA